MRTTIKDIADYTGFSVTTISLVLNHKPNKIPQSTKDIIFQAAEKLNYRPNQLAVGLVKKRTKTIGLIISDVSNIFFAALAKGVEDACREKGWNLILCNTGDQHERDLSYIQVLADKGVDGVLFCMARDSNKKKTEESIKLLKRLRLPFVMIDRYLEEADCSSVIVNHNQGGYNATKYLIEQGHRKIACVTGPLDLEDSKERLEGYKRALKEAGIAYNSRLVYEGDYTYKSGEEAAKVLVKKGKDISAIFAFNDMSAYGVYSALKKKHIHVPEQISLIGYDDIFFSEILDIPLTTMRQPVYDMGAEGVQLLLDIVEEKGTARKCIIFQTELVIRESVKKLEQK